MSFISFKSHGKHIDGFKEANNIILNILPGTKAVPLYRKFIYLGCKPKNNPSNQSSMKIPNHNLHINPISFTPTLGRNQN